MLVERRTCEFLKHEFEEYKYAKKTHGIEELFYKVIGKNSDIFTRKYQILSYFKKQFHLKENQADEHPNITEKLLNNDELDVSTKIVQKTKLDLQPDNKKNLRDISNKSSFQINYLNKGNIDKYVKRKRERSWSYEKKFERINRERNKRTIIKEEIKKEENEHNISNIAKNLNSVCNNILSKTEKVPFNQVYNRYFNEDKNNVKTYDSNKKIEVISEFCNSSSKHQTHKDIRNQQSSFFSKLNETLVLQISDPKDGEKFNILEREKDNDLEFAFN